MTPILFAIVLASVSFNASAQVALRKAMMHAGPPTAANAIPLFVEMISDVYLWLGLSFFAASVLLWLFVLARVPVSIAYPMSSIGYVIATAMAVVFLKENVSLIKMIGLALICFGVTLLATSK